MSVVIDERCTSVSYRSFTLAKLLQIEHDDGYCIVHACVTFHVVYLCLQSVIDKEVDLINT